MDDVSRILVFVPNWVGDVVMATPAMCAIRRRFGGARIVHLMRPYVADVLANAGFSNERVFWPAGGEQNSLIRHAELIRRLRRERFDLAVLFTNSFRSALIARLAGARRRIGYDRDGRGWLLTDRLAPLVIGRGEGESAERRVRSADGAGTKRARAVGTAGAAVAQGNRTACTAPRGAARLRRRREYVPVSALDYYNELARSAGCEEPGDRLTLATTAADEAAIEARLGKTERGQPLIVLNPGANYGSAKCWPTESYAALADALVDRYAARVVASLGPKEREIADRLRSTARKSVDIFMDPPLGLGPLKALVRRCDLLITNDTGPRHFAAAFDVPVVTVFGSSDPAWTDTRFAKERIVTLALECQPCMERMCPLGHHHCMRLLRPEAVLERAAELLAGRESRVLSPDC